MDEEARQHQQDWTVIAIDQLRHLIQQVQALDETRSQCERIVKALTAAEVRGIPELPWRKSKESAPKRYAGSDGECARCGKPFNGARPRQAPDGKFVCWRSDKCDAPELTEVAV